jgi:hypothetical protein
MAADKKATPEAERVFSRIYDMYTDDEGNFTPETASWFIHACTGEKVKSDDTRIKSNLFEPLDEDKDGKL